MLCVWNFFNNINASRSKYSPNGIRSHARCSPSMFTLAMLVSVTGRNASWNERDTLYSKDDRKMCDKCDFIIYVLFQHGRQREHHQRHHDECWPSPPCAFLTVEFVHWNLK